MANGKSHLATLTVPTATYYLGAANYLINLSRDFGDYHGSAGYPNPVTVSAVFINGQLDSCSAIGGLEYATNAKLPVRFLDPPYQRSGANANVTTDVNEPRMAA